MRRCVCAGDGARGGGGGYNFLNAITKNEKIQGLGLFTGLQIPIPQTVSGMNLISGQRGFGGGVGPPPAPAQGTRSGHSRFLHRLPPLATGVGDVGAATVHGAQPAAAPPRERAQTARCPGPGSDQEDCSGRRRLPRSHARSTCVLPGRWQRRRAPRAGAPAAPRVRVRCPGLELRCEGRRPVSEAAQVPSIPAKAAQRCPQVRRPEWRRSLGRLFGILAWVARCGAAPRDRRRGPLGKGGAAALLLGLPLSRVLPACRTRTPAALRCHQLPLGYAAASGLRQWSWSRSRDRASNGLSL